MSNKVTTEQTVLDNVRHDIENYDDVVLGAKNASDAEKNMTIREGIKRYPKAMAWSILLSTAIIMEGFDVVLLGNFYALPQFVKAYGELLPNGQYSISATWQAGLSNGANVGEIIGLAINGWASERFGYKKTMIAALASMICFIFIPFFAQNIQTLLVAEILQGIPWGIFQTLTTAYAAEVCPVPLRPALTAYVNLCWVLGQLIASGVLRSILNLDSQWAYRIPFALQWMWPAPILIGTIFAPESPWWLTRKGRHEDARRSIERLNQNPTAQQVDDQLNYMIHTNAIEKTLAEGTSYWQCFRGTDLRRTEIASGVWAIQNLCGSAFMGYSTYFLEQAGLPIERAFDLSIGQYAIGACGTVTSWFLMRHIGRRTLYIYGLIAMFFLLIVIGGLGWISTSNTSAQYVIGAMLLLYTAIYDGTVGPVCYCLVAEISSTRLRAKTVVISRIVYNIFGIVNAVMMPYFLNPTELNWGAKTGLFWAGLCFLCLVWCYFRVPEPKDRTYGELDVLFENRISARKFATTDVDQFGSHRAGSVENFDEKKGGKDLDHVEYRS